MDVRGRRPRVATALLLAACLTVAVPPGGGRLVAAAGSGEPEMCSGRHGQNTTVIAGIRGSTTSPKFILNVVTDAAGVPAGTLVFERDGERVYVDRFCRVWQHLPGQPGGTCMEGGTMPEGAITAHAVGIGTYKGTAVLVRADARETTEGSFFRLRWKPMGSGEEGGMSTAAMDGGDGCEEGEWTRYPVPDETGEEEDEEAWAALDRLTVKVGAVE